MNKEVKELLNKCDNCKLKECIGCEFTCVDIQKIKKYVGNIEILNETYQVINELSEREIKKLEQKESILDRVTKTLKRDREIFDKCRKKHEMYSPSEERMNTKYHYTEKLLNIIEGETNNEK